MKTIKILAAAAIAALTIGCAEAQSTASPPLQMDNEMFANPAVKLFEADRKYGYVKWCYGQREGYLSVWINDVQLERARLRVKAIEDDAVAKVSDVNPKDLWKLAMKSLQGAWVNARSCTVVYEQLMSLPAPGNAGGVDMKKDF